ncbi:putative ribonuclease H-like domain-containing protein [Tanacetum coccineum]
MPRIESTASKSSKDSLGQPKNVRPVSLVIEECESDSDDDCVFRPSIEQNKPSYSKINFSPRVDKRNWNGLMTQKLGDGFEFSKKACFVCGSLNHLIKDNNFYENKMVGKSVSYNKGRVTGQKEVRLVWKNAQRVNHQNKLTHPHPKRNFVPTVVATKSGLVPINAAKQSSPRAAASTSTARPFNQKSAAKTKNLSKKVYTAKVNNVTTAGLAVGNPQYALQDQGIFDSRCSRHMTGNKSYLTDYQDINGGFVTFTGSPKEGKIKTGKLDFEDVDFVKELKFNLFSFSQMCDKKNSVLFTETECLVLSPDFKLLDESQVLLKVPRHNNMYSFDLKNVVPSGGLVGFFFATKDETSGILKTFITGIENQINHNVKIIICDNGTEFKNNDMNQFCRIKGIKREFSVAKTLQQNGVAKRTNRTLIKAAKTMLADSLLPTTFWAKAVSTACYVQNRVLVTKPHNKTPYKLLHGRPPSINFMRPFGCSVTILNTLDPLGKFDEKVNEGFFVGYSINSKAFRVFNTRTRKVEENLHINLIENKPNVVWSGPDWLFDIDLLTNSMNYEPVTAGNQTNKNAGIKDNVDAVSTQQYILITLLYNSPQSLEDAVADDASKKTNEEPANEGKRNGQKKKEELQIKKMTRITISPSVSTAGQIFTNVDDLPTDPLMPDLEDTADLLYIEPKKVIQALTDQAGRKQWKRSFYNLNFKRFRLWIEAIRLFLAYTSFMGFIVYQMDVKSAFLCGTIEEEVYVCQLHGFEDPQFPNKFYKVEKALYGLHQALRAWYETLSTYLLENGFRIGTIDKTLFIKKDRGDILLVQMSSMGELTFFLGLQVQQKEDGIFSSQDKHVADILKKFDFVTVKTTSTPMEPNKALVKDEEAEDVDVHLYKSMIKSLMYLTTSRTNITFAVCACARFQVTPKISHLHAVKRIFRYLKATQTRRMTKISKELAMILDGKADEGFLVRYSINSKTFRVFNSRTRKVKENLHTNFLENKPNVTGSGLEWLFDIDSLTKSMNYEPVTAGNQTNGDAGIETNSTYDKDADEVPDKGDDDVSQRNGQEKEGGASNKENDQHVQDFRAKLDSLPVQQKYPIPNDSSMQSLEKTGIFDDADDDREVGAEADLNNLETTMNVSPISITRIHKDHPIDQIIGNINSATQTRRMTKISEEHAMTLVDLPKGKRAIGTKWVYRNKKDERGIIVKNKAKLVSQGYTQEKGIDYDEVFAPIARIEAIKLFLAYASFMGFIVFQMDVKSAFLYGLQVQQKEDEIFISQDKYVADILKKLNFVTIKTASTPMEPNKALVKDEEAEDVDVHLYRTMIRSLMYLIASRPDITFAVCACARFQVTPKISHLHVVKRIFIYLKGQPNLGLWYHIDSPFDLEAFFDSNYAGASLDRKSTTRVDYVAAANYCGQVLWIQNQMLDYGFNFMNTKIYIDNESTICIVKNPMFHSKTKHIEIRHHFIRDSYEKKLIQDRKSSMVGFGEMRQAGSLEVNFRRN